MGQAVDLDDDWSGKRISSVARQEDKHAAMHNTSNLQLYATLAAGTAGYDKQPGGLWGGYS